MHILVVDDTIIIEVVFEIIYILIVLTFPIVTSWYLLFVRVGGMSSELIDYILVKLFILEGS